MHFRCRSVNYTLAALALIYSTHRLLVVWIILWISCMLPIFTFVVCWIAIPTSLYTILEVSAVRRPMRVCCGSRWGRCVLFINIWDSLTASCVVYNTAMYTLYGRCSQCGRCMFIHWPVRTVHGLYGPRRRCRTGCAKQGTGCPWNLWSLKFPA